MGRKFRSIFYSIKGVGTGNSGRHVPQSFYLLKIKGRPVKKNQSAQNLSKILKEAIKSITSSLGALIPSLHNLSFPLWGTTDKIKEKFFLIIVKKEILFFYSLFRYSK